MFDWSVGRPFWKYNLQIEVFYIGIFAYCYFSLAKRLVREAQEKVDHFTHPDRYIFNYMPGGSLYMRNAPIPLDVCFPDGKIPDDVEPSPLEAINIEVLVHSTGWAIERCKLVRKRALQKTVHRRLPQAQLRLFLPCLIDHLSTRVLAAAVARCTP